MYFCGVKGIMKLAGRRAKEAGAGLGKNRHFGARKAGLRLVQVSSDAVNNRGNPERNVRTGTPKTGRIII